MTTAPQTLLDARRLLLTHLDIQPGRTVHTDLDPAEVGIVADPAHVGGYHCGSDRVRRVDGQIRDYSVTESSRDRTGLADWACALDIGEFRVTVGSRVYDLPHLSAWIVGQCRAGAADARDIREVIWSADGRTVQRWDRLGRRSTGDSSHRWHTHISYHRDAIKAGRDQAGLFRRYLTSIGLLAGEDDDMPTVGEFWAAEFGPKDARVTAGTMLARAAGAADRMTRMEATLAQLAGRDLVDEEQIVAGVLAGLAPETLAERIAAHLPADHAQRVADELAARLSQGQARG